MYILKTKGSAKIPSYLQVRDNDFILINHCKLDNASIIEKIGTPINEKTIDYIMDELPFGVIHKIEN